MALRANILHYVKWGSVAPFRGMNGNSFILNGNCIRLEDNFNRFSKEKIHCHDNPVYNDGVFQT